MVPNNVVGDWEGSVGRLCESKGAIFQPSITLLGICCRKVNPFSLVMTYDSAY